jgi:hypothetical protein
MFLGLIGGGNSLTGDSTDGMRRGRKLIPSASRGSEDSRLSQWKTEGEILTSLRGENNFKYLCY